MSTVVDLAGYVFDRIVFAKGTDLHFELERNGFTEARKDDAFLEIIGLPSDVNDLGGETKPIYSSGKYWKT